MPTSSKPSLRSVGVHPLLVVAAGLMLSPSAWAYQKDALNIMVQSTVEAPVVAKGGRAVEPAPRGKIYFMAPALEEGSALKLIKPVDPKMMEAEVHKVLRAKGYRPATRGETPDLTITVLFGRGWVHNPYPSSVPGTNWSIRDVKKLESSGAYVPFSGILEGKRQVASEEKLAIVIAGWAWDPPAMIKHKAKLLWRTLVYIDDPDHRDFNTIADKLLAVGADYFDRETEVPEVEAIKPLPEGRVELGTERVVEEPTGQK